MYTRIGGVHSGFGGVHRGFGGGGPGLWIPVYSYGFLYIAIYSYGFLYIPTYSYIFLYIPMDSYIFVWISYTFQYILVCSYKFQYIPMDSLIFLYIPMDSYTFLRNPLYFIGVSIRCCFTMFFEKTSPKVPGISKPCKRIWHVVLLYRYEIPNIFGGVLEIFIDTPCLCWFMLIYVDSEPKWRLTSAKCRQKPITFIFMMVPLCVPGTTLRPTRRLKRFWSHVS